MYENFTTERVILRHLMLEEYGPTIKYIKGTDSDTEYYLIRLMLVNSEVTQSDTTGKNLSERYCIDKLDG